MSGFLDTAAGFIPVVSPITEPAVGYGASGGLLFVQRQEQAESAGSRRPNLTFVGGLGTENGTWGTLGQDVRYWLDDRLKTTVVLWVAHVELEHYGVGDIAALQP